MLRYCLFNQATKHQLREYFEQGLSPAGAMRVHLDHMKMDPDAHHQLLADAALNPNPRACYHEHDKWRKQNFSESGLESILQKLNNKLDTYKELEMGML